MLSDGTTVVGLISEEDEWMYRRDVKCLVLLVLR